MLILRLKRLYAGYFFSPAKGYDRTRYVKKDTTMSETAERQDTTQILSFSLNNEEYGVDILRVNTIREWTNVTTLPEMPNYFRGVFNLRGTIVPVIDLRERLGMPQREYDPTTVVILLNVQYKSNELVIGIVVDSVSDTHSINVQDIKETPTVGDCAKIEYLHGLVEIDKRLILLLDMTKLLSDKQFEHLSSLN